MRLRSTKKGINDMRGAPTTVATWDQQALKVFLTWRSHDPVVGSIPRLLGLLPEQQSHAELRSSVGEDDIARYCSRPHRRRRMQHNWRYAGGDKARKSAMRQVLFIAGGNQSFGFNLFVHTRNLDPNPKHSESQSIMFYQYVVSLVDSSLGRVDMLWGCLRRLDGHVRAS